MHAGGIHRVRCSKHVSPAARCSQTTTNITIGTMLVPVDQQLHCNEPTSLKVRPTESVWFFVAILMTPCAIAALLFCWPYGWKSCIVIFVGLLAFAKCVDLVSLRIQVSHEGFAVRRLFSTRRIQWPEIQGVIFGVLRGRSGYVNGNALVVLTAHRKVRFAVSGESILTARSLFLQNAAHAFIAEQETGEIIGPSILSPIRGEDDYHLVRVRRYLISYWLLVRGLVAFPWAPFVGYAFSVLNVSSPKTWIIPLLSICLAGYTCFDARRYFGQVHAAPREPSHR